MRDSKAVADPVVRSRFLVGVRITAEEPSVGSPEIGDRGNLVRREIEAAHVEVLALPLWRRGLGKRERAQV
jgi:hypothetical protein